MEKTKTLVGRLAGAAILAGVGFAATLLPPGPRFTIGILILLPSAILLLIARAKLDKSFAVRAEAKTLVTTGLYARILHPMYFFLDLTLLGLIIAVKWPALLMVWGAVVLIQSFGARREESVLAAAFGKEYEAYKARTWF